eukprot:TRINITY_DN360_c0_g1_i1.p1 TRINITY_DN360_c0_g1~~TRINITY_DN360_c0_g1_i1.p1  ORF type:complete len:225 (+),score=41.92 TRINITY_DN360_c0_g1_i1:265-939(+)
MRKHDSIVIDASTEEPSFMADVVSQLRVVSDQLAASDGSDCDLRLRLRLMLAIIRARIDVLRRNHVHTVAHAEEIKRAISRKELEERTLRREGDLLDTNITTSHESDSSTSTSVPSAVSEVCRAAGVWVRPADSGNIEDVLVVVVDRLRRQGLLSGENQYETVPVGAMAEVGADMSAAEQMVVRRIVASAARDEGAYEVVMKILQAERISHASHLSRLRVTNKS